MADGLFTRDGLFHVMPEVDIQPLEELFRARIITFLVEKGLLPPARAEMTKSLSLPKGCVAGCIPASTSTRTNNRSRWGRCVLFRPSGRPNSVFVAAGEYPVILKDAVWRWD